MIHQLRIYEIFDRNREAFLARFDAHSAPIMARHGFRLLAAWETRTARRREFAYLLAWPDEETMRSAWTAFLADAQWLEVKRTTREAHGALVGAIEDRVLVPVGNPTLGDPA
ncbi:MAG: NIPSNAP family protein [Burkholderiales bacterium]|nr:NIPSNAP family protein [Burkholderiales bacterium]MCE7877610.1 NIPSNAP family containing protein [Betaproteobacteria bacterium PRO3]